jgi:DNA-binding PadR family transcriptional regulator
MLAEGRALPADLAGLGRFAEPSLVILLALGDGPKHGYAIMAEARKLTGEPLGPGTLYATLSRLEARGLIEPLPAEDRRRPYRLTADGAAVLQAQLVAIEGIVQAGLARLGRPGNRSARSKPTTS